MAGGGVVWNGKTDILWRNGRRGDFVYWTMNQDRRTNAAYINPPYVPVQWHLGGTF
jgi:hypothetical protein